jgi:hypothetical protein
MSSGFFITMAQIGDGSRSRPNINANDSAAVARVSTNGSERGVLPAAFHPYGANGHEAICRALAVRLALCANERHDIVRRQVGPQL